ncbi:MAG: hypothetical protein JWN85_4901 [Gammaproteobacteria bacterium]|jgi:hypothetical protein|nr:hypothetical protein [Gammaproteobacteria bacterium]
MTADPASLTHHPAPHRDRVGRYESAFGLLGGPLAWFVQLCTGYGLASWSCFPKDQRGLTPIEGAAWIWPTIIAMLVAAVVIALAACYTSWRLFRRTRDEAAKGHHHLMEVGVGRTRFVALWGVLLGGGFALATIINAVAFMVLPRCAG